MLADCGGLINCMLQLLIISWAASSHMVQLKGNLVQLPVNLTSARQPLLGKNL